MKIILSYLVDSGIVLKTKDKVLYNSNDCLPCTKAINFIKDKFKKVDLALLPYTGVSGYPNCYLNPSHKEKLKEAKGFQLRDLKFYKKLHKQLNQI